MIITGEKEEARHKIGDFFVTFAIEDRKNLVISCIVMDQAMEGVFQAHMLHLPIELQYIFNSTYHLYKYLAQYPQAVHQITENSFTFTFVLQNNTHLRSIPLMRPELSQYDRIMMKKLILQLQNEQERKRSATTEVNALKSELERQKKESQQLSNTLHLKQIILKDIKESKGEFIELD